MIGFESNAIMKRAAVQPEGRCTFRGILKMFSNAKLQKSEIMKSESFKCVLHRKKSQKQALKIKV